jgi:hypothetical protein
VNGHRLTGLIFLSAVPQLSTYPWPHLVVDNFLSPDILTRSLEEIRSEQYAFEIENRGQGRIEFSLLKSETLWRAIYCRETMGLLMTAFNIRVSLNRKNFVQLRRMNDQTPDFPIHNDFTADGKTIASFLYLSPGWKEEFRGHFNLFAAREQISPSSRLAPVQNRFLAFVTDATHWHAVDRPLSWERLSVLALWDVVED